MGDVYLNSWVLREIFGTWLGLAVRFEASILLARGGRSPESESFWEQLVLRRLKLIFLPPSVPCNLGGVK